MLTLTTRGPWDEAEFPAVSMRDLMVPLDTCFTVPEGPVGLRTTAELKRNDFSQAVVATDGPSPRYGVVSLERLNELNHEGLPLRVDGECVHRSLLSCDGTAGWRKDVARLQKVFSRPVPLSLRLSHMRPSVRLDRLLEALTARPATLVACYDTEVEADQPDAIGLVTLADLNKHNLRAAIYPLLAELEGLLAGLVERRFGDDPWEWIMRLTSEDSRARIVGYWKLSEREGVNVGATAGAMLSELLRAVAAAEDVRASLGYPSRTALEQATKHLHRFRNLTMHPVRPLIGSMDDCRDLKDALAVAIGLLNAPGGEQLS